MLRKLPALLLVLGLFCSGAFAQTMIPIPAHASVYSSSARGFWFTAPTNFTITGLRVPVEAGTGLQYIHVMKCNDPLPVAFTAQSSNFTTLQYINGAPNGVIQTVNITVNAGDVIGILGTAGTGNSYSASAVISSSILGFPITLARFGYQGNINTGPAPSYWGESVTTAGQISRVEVYYGSSVTTPPACLTAPVAPAQNATGVCSGPTTLRWRKAAGATGYDVYLNAGTASPTTMVSSNQADTSYTATTVPGAYRWRIVPRNSAGIPTGCSDWAFTVIPGITPDVTITVGPNDTVCLGASATYTAAPVYGGSAPAYQWLKNNLSVGTNSPVYMDPAPANNDLVKVVLTSNETGCLSINKDTSNTIKMTVLPSPAVTITPAGPTAFCHGGSVRLDAPAGGLTYQWKINGAPLAGATAQSYTASYSGDYSVQMTTTNSFCPSLSDTVDVTAYATPFPLVNRNGSVLTTASFYTSYQWYYNNAAIPGATTNTLTITRDGIYRVVVTDTAACGGSSVDVPVNSMAVPGLSGSEVSIYPNPASDEVRINSRVPVTVTLRTIDGKTVLCEKEVTTIQVGQLTPGIYLLYIHDGNGRLVKTEKLIKEGRK